MHFSKTSTGHNPFHLFEPCFLQSPVSEYGQLLMRQMYVVLKTAFNRLVDGKLMQFTDTYGNVVIF